jgi:hypothetical protein
MEPESSLLRSQEPATDPYSKPDESSPRPHLKLFKIHFNITLVSRCSSSKWSYSFVFSYQKFIYIISHACRVHYCYY